MGSKFSALQIANFYIQLVNSIPDDSIDNLKLNKLIYFAQGHSLSKLGEPLFSDVFEAWDFGPVVPEVYHSYRCCGRNPIVDPSESFDESLLSSEELSVLVDVYSNYGKYSGIALKDMTHMDGTPWKKVYVKGNNVKIPNEMIKEYFNHDDSFKSFEIDTEKAEIVSKIPANWDSEEDEIYGNI